MQNKIGIHKRHWRSCNYCFERRTRKNNGKDYYLSIEILIISEIAKILSDA